ncbi:DUF2249 domain-containing protein [Flammeovirga agarivorans]|uniref:DUF2249 domain-containing protein n=1 Tax=Flammeovirga agarivorans TaxID=2726742 RepID=A0A7X8SJT9_9BACT|nr:DUF2249 domain-containing protein [Flammeovirga agarivorans]NLR91480.1 DUF2249 domain-containing protein [Flammeovirga agarivorans]
MNITLSILDLRKIQEEQRIKVLNKELDNLTKEDSLWLIDDHEPFDIYNHLIIREHHFETFIVSKSEYRVFISPCYI